MSQRIYLASPYTSPYAVVCSIRFDGAAEAAKNMSEAGITVYSPVVYGHTLSQLGLRGDFAFWSEHCLSFLESWATEVQVLTLPGWEKSVGVRAEVEAAQRLGLPVLLRDPVTGVTEPYHV